MMATAPVKPQPLHNFPLNLKWGQTTALAPAANHHHDQHHRSSSSRSTVAELETESENETATRPPAPTPPTRVGSRSARLHRMSFTSCSTILPKAEKTSPEKRAGGTVVFENSGKSQKQAVVLDSNNCGVQSEGEEEKRRKDEEEGGNLRPWKLRPRKGISKEAAAAVPGNEHRERESNRYQVHQPKSMRLRGSAENGSGNGGAREELVEKKEKRKFWIALSREEIEEDIFIMTGSRPPRRPKKRPKNVQRVLDVRRSPPFLL
uniref:Uncharacterized protein n=1 Tax=Rhizophora mucronata TaxID=61149 RepID=A0A2P2K1V2_RHIMU